MTDFLKLGRLDGRVAIVAYAPGDQVGQELRAALVGHVHHVDTGHLLEHLGVEVLQAANA